MLTDIEELTELPHQTAEHHDPWERQARDLDGRRPRMTS